MWVFTWLLFYADDEGFDLFNLFLRWGGLDCTCCGMGLWELELDLGEGRREKGERGME